MGEHVNEMDTGRIPKQIISYQPRGQRFIGCTVKRWEENMRR